MGIRLSKKHGVNPPISVCFYCNKEKNEIVLPGMMPGDVEAPRKAVWDKTPCDECAGYMQQGIILISVNEKLSGKDLQNPYRTGGWVVVKEKTVMDLITTPELAEHIRKQRVAFIPDDAWEKLGLPKY